MLRVFVEVHLLYLGGSHDYARKESSKLTKLTSYLGSSVHRRNALLSLQFKDLQISEGSSRGPPISSILLACTFWYCSRLDWIVLAHRFNMNEKTSIQTDSKQCSPSRDDYRWLEHFIDLIPGAIKELKLARWVPLNCIVFFQVNSQI